MTTPEEMAKLVTELCQLNIALRGHPHSNRLDLVTRRLALALLDADTKRISEQQLAKEIESLTSILGEGIKVARAEISEMVENGHYAVVQQGPQEVQ